MNFKHAACLSQIASCPPPSCAPVAREAFRFVHANPDHPHNFAPVAVINPKRVLPTAELRCSSYALSFFTSKENAKKRYAELSKSIKNIKLTIGDSVALLAISPADGVATAVSNSGHFDLFEIGECHFSTRIGNVEVICDA